MSQETFVVLYSLAIFVIFSTNRAISLISLAAVGLSAYSLPVLTGWTTTVSLGTITSAHVKTSEAATLAMAMAWLGFVFAAATPVLKNKGLQKFSIKATDLMTLRVCFAIGVVLLVPVIATSGVLFFLKSRAEAFESPVIMIWRWVCLIGLLMSLSLNKPAMLVYFAAVILTIFISGDRTLFVLSIFSIALQARYGSKLLGLRNVRMGIILVPVLLIFLIYAKPFYLFLKDSSAPFSAYMSNDEGVLESFWLLEPFGVHYLLEMVIISDLRIGLSDIILPTIAQVLVFPSAFGVDTHLYNKILSNTLFPGVTYGIAFNLWAQGYSFGGAIGVFLFGLLYGLLIKALNFFIGSWRGVPRFCILIFGVMVAIYGHRNSIENIVSFGRQILLAGVLVASVSYIIGVSFYARTSNRANRRVWWS